MGFSFKKLAKKALKFGAKVAPQLLAATPVGGLVMRAQQAVKSLGVNPRSAKAKPEPLSVQAAIAKPALSIMSSRQGARRTLKALKASPRAKRGAGKGRTPPSGGLDLKAIAAKWRAQGKPGTWLGFIKANPIRKRA